MKLRQEPNISEKEPSSEGLWSQMQRIVLRPGLELQIGNHHVLQPGKYCFETYTPRPVCFAFFFQAVEKAGFRDLQNLLRFCH